MDYSLKVVKRTNVPVGSIGLVVAKVGRDPSPIRGLQDHVECSYFQDGPAFLLGGQRGRQPGVLPGGTTYAIDPDLFDVITTETVGGRKREELTTDDLKEITIGEGYAGVVIVREGLAPDGQAGEVAPRVEGHESFQLPHVFLANGGQRGVQEEILTRGGSYRINPWFARVVVVPINDLTLGWAEREVGYSWYDSNLRPIRVNVKGHRIRCDVTQTIRIPASTAPRLVGRIGEAKSRAAHTDDKATIRRFVDGVLCQTVEGHLQSTASGQPDPVAFLEGLDTVRTELEDKVRQALRDWGVEGISTTFTRFESEDERLDEARRTESYAKAEEVRLTIEKVNKQIESEIAKGPIRVDRFRRQQDTEAYVERREATERLDRTEDEARWRFSVDQLRVIRGLDLRIEEVRSRLEQMGTPDPTPQQVMETIQHLLAEKQLPPGDP